MRSCPVVSILVGVAESEIYLDVAAVARLLGVKSSRAYQLISAGNLPALRRGRRILIPKLALNAWLEEEAATALAATKRPAEGAG